MRFYLRATIVSLTLTVLPGFFWAQAPEPVIASFQAQCAFRFVTSTGGTTADTGFRCVRVD